MSNKRSKSQKKSGQHAATSWAASRWRNTPSPSIHESSEDDISSAGEVLEYKWSEVISPDKVKSDDAVQVYISCIDKKEVKNSKWKRNIEDSEWAFTFCPE